MVLSEFEIKRVHCTSNYSLASSTSKRWSMSTGGALFGFRKMLILLCKKTPYQLPPTWCFPENRVSENCYISRKIDATEYSWVYLLLNTSFSNAFLHHHYFSRFFGLFLSLCSTHVVYFDQKTTIKWYKILLKINGKQ